MARVAGESRAVSELSALILAGSRPGAPDPVAEAEGVPHKSLALVEGRSSLARVHAALCAAGIARVVVSANDPAVIAEAQRLGADVLPPAAGPSDSVARVFAQMGAPLLVTTADHALLEADWVRQFVRDAGTGTDVAVGLARREAVEAALPGARRTWLRFADGEWSGCNLFLLARPDALNAISAWREVEADRKRPWRIARRLGLSTLWDYWRGRLTLAEAIARLGKRLGVTSKLVAMENGRAAIDVDSVADLETARLLASRTL